MYLSVSGKTIILIKNRVVGGEKGEVAQIMYIHVSKCKNDKIKFKKLQ
jgi:hypothetical protein